VLDKSNACEHCWSNRVRVGSLKRARPGASDLNRRSVEQMNQITNEVASAVEQYVKESAQRAARVANDPVVRASVLEFVEVIRRSWLRNGGPAAA